MLLFTEVAHSLKKISSERNGSNVKPHGFLKDFFLVEEMLNQERSEFEVSFLSLSYVECSETLTILLLSSFSFSCYGVKKLLFFAYDEVLFLFLLSRTLPFSLIELNAGKYSKFSY